MPLACIIHARTHDQKNDCFFDLEMINDDYNYARGGFPLETYQPPMYCSGSPACCLLWIDAMLLTPYGAYARTSGAGTGTPPPPPPTPRPDPVLPPYYSTYGRQSGSGDGNGDGITGTELGTLINK